MNRASILDTAIDLFARYRSGRQNAAERAELNAWIAASDEHSRAWEKVTAMWAEVGALEEQPVIAEYREDARRRVQRRRWMMGGIAAALLPIAAIGTIIASGTAMRDGKPEAPAPTQAQLAEQLYSTGIGERSELRLSDGSRLTLDAASSVGVRIGEKRRHVRLIRGRALFRVAKDAARPFTVSTDLGDVTALGTIFSVDHKTRTLSVALLEGSVRVTQPGTRTAASTPASIILKPGQKLTEDAGAWDIERFDGSSILAWTRGQLVFDNEPISHVVEEVNRYSPHKIRIADAEIGRRRLSAVLHSDDLTELRGAIELMGIGRVRTMEDGSFLIVAQ